jgi:hypothetical protein
MALLFIPLGAQALPNCPKPRGETASVETLAGEGSQAHDPPYFYPCVRLTTLDNLSHLSASFLKEYATLVPFREPRRVPTLIPVRAPTALLQP